MKSAKTSTDLPSFAPDVAKEYAVLVHKSHKERPLASSVPQSTPAASTTFEGTSTESAKNIGSGLEYVSTSIKR